MNNQLSNVQGSSGSSYTTAAQTAKPSGPDGAPSTTPNCPVYGPSSGHSAIVNHLMADGSVHCLSKQIDCSAYMFLITKNGSDPNPPIP